MNTTTTSSLSKRMQETIAKARLAGWTVEQAGSLTLVYKLVGRWKKKEGVFLYADGSPYLLNVDLSAQARLTYKQLESYLGIK